MYIHIKDSKNKESHKDSVIKKYVECSKGDIASTEYTYTFNTSKTYADINGSTTTLITPSQNQKITMDRCAGKCYDHDNIFGYYDRKITYLDRFDSSKTCDNTTIATPTRVCDSSNNCIDAYLTIQYKATCSFKDCFLKNGSYETYAIGTQEYPLDAEDYWNETIDGVVYECTSYYKQYVSSNDSHSENITLREVVNEPICGAAIGKYAYNSSASRPYVRVDDTFVDEGD